MRDFAAHRVAVTQHRKLPGINAGGTIFAGLIDADHAGLCRSLIGNHACAPLRKRAENGEGAKCRNQEIIACERYAEQRPGCNRSGSAAH
jgi:hypothetical protein